jgi:hypothetical protein
MAASKLSLLLPIATALSLASCSFFQAHSFFPAKELGSHELVTATAPMPAEVKKVAEKTTTKENADLPLPDKKSKVAALPSEDVPLPDGIRMPDLLAMPTDADFRPTNPAAKRAQAGGPSGAVIARPPTDPPSRVKPKSGE